MPKSADSRHRPPPSTRRPPALADIRNRKMARSAHAYVRGNTLRFYEWLDSLAPSALPEGPAAWICGDCHLGNLGPLADADGGTEIALRDFDQTVVGNPAHDVIRLGLSLAMAARGSDLPGVVTAQMLEQLIEGYEQAFGDEAPESVGRHKPRAVRVALKEAQRRTWKHLAAERTKGETVEIPLGRRFWPVTQAERNAIAKLLATPEVHALATRLGHREDDAEVELLDVAYWVKGCSSLGWLRYAVLLDVGRRATKGRDLCLVDIKEAPKAAAPRYADTGMPRENAQRVVEGARALSPSLGERMVAARLMERPVVLRELMPQDLKLEIERVDQQEAMNAARFLAQVVGRAHARQMDEDTRSAWRAELARNRSKTLDAPSWLWTSVVELVALHERGYLDHCRRYALAGTEGML